MDPAYVVLLIAVTLAIAVIATYLIIIGAILKTVFSRLRTILAAVSEVTVKTAPAGAVIDEINQDLAAGHEALQAAVLRLRERTERTESSRVDDRPTDTPISAGSSAAQKPWPSYPIRGSG